MSGKTIVAFGLGILVAEHAHGVSRRFSGPMSEKMLKILEEVAKGELTLLDTPAETIPDLPPVPEHLAKNAPKAAAKVREFAEAQFRMMHAKAIKDHRIVAAEILSELPPSK